MKTLITLAALGLAAGLAACGEKPEDKAAAEAPAAAAPAAPAADNMAGMASAPAAKMVKSTGTVTAVDAAGGSITLDHAPIPEAGWPAMTMAFKAAPSIVQCVKVGDKVAFDLSLKDGAGEVTALQKQ